MRKSVVKEVYMRWQAFSGGGNGNFFEVPLRKFSMDRFVLCFWYFLC